MTGLFNFSYAENWRTFFYDAGYIKDTLSDIGGPAALLSDFITQFFISPRLGAALYLLLLGFIVWQTDKLLKRICGTHIFLPAAALPAVALAVLSFNVNYLNSGTVAFAIAIVFLNLQRRFETTAGRLVYTIVSSFLLFLLAGPVAMLYAVSCLLIELFCNPGKSYLFILAPVLVSVAALSALFLGWSAEIRNLITPYGYFNPRLRAGSIVWLPWSLEFAVLAAACLWKTLNPGIKRFRWAFLGISCAIFVWFAFFNAPSYIDKTQEQFKRLSYEAGREDWDAVLKTCNGLSMNNLMHQNYLNVALAEKGVLGDYLFTYPSYDIQSIYIQGSRNPHVYSLLSDVYWSMGHIAFSQRYAFEANESLGGYSPRLLRRLVQTNEALGYDAVAAKYRRLLSKTLFYRRWAEEYSVPEIKKHCVFPDNRFCGINGLDDDLAEIVGINPEHYQTTQYLGSLCLLLRDLPKFVRYIERFYGTPSMPEVLPVSFQEALALYYENNPEMLDYYNVHDEVLSRLAEYRLSPLKEKNSFWYFILNKQ